MDKPLADNFRNLNNDITFLNNSQTIYYMVLYGIIYIKYWEANPVNLMLTRL